MKSNCLELARNARLCGGAQEYEKRIHDLEEALKEAKEMMYTAIGILYAAEKGVYEPREEEIA